VGGALIETHGGSSHVPPALDLSDLHLTFISSQTFISSSARCVGLSTLALNLALQDIPAPSEVPASEQWLHEYLEGANKELYGLQLRDTYTGLAFTAAARQVYADYGVIMLACQDDLDGRVIMNPGSACILREATVVFVIAPSEKATDAIRRHRYVSLRVVTSRYLSLRILASSTPTTDAIRRRRYVSLRLSLRLVASRCVSLRLVASLVASRCVSRCVSLRSVTYRCGGGTN